MSTTAPIPPVIVYHAADLDGKCSAAIALRALRASQPGLEPTMLPQDYGWPLPPETYFPAGADVCILDFSFPPSYMHSLTERCRVTWIDHHTPRIRELQAAGIPAHCVAAVLADHEPSASYLTWSHFHPDLPLPQAVNLIDAWDSTPDPRRSGGHWEHYIRPFQLGARLHDCAPESPLWDTLLADASDTDRNALILDGRPILRYLDQTNRELIPKLAYTLQLHLPPIMVTDPPESVSHQWELAPLLALLLNRHPADPKDLLCHPLCQPSADPFASCAVSPSPRLGVSIPPCPLQAPHVLLTWGYEGAQSLWRLSMSPGPAAPDLDCGRICRAVWGGGGHPGRAGATFTHLPTELVPYCAALAGGPTEAVCSTPAPVPNPTVCKTH